MGFAQSARPIAHNVIPAICSCDMSCFFTDHADPAGRWYTTHGEIRGDASAYPYTPEDYRRVMEEIAALGKPVLTLSHYSYAGGNRAAPLFDRFLPVAGNVRMHFYSHAHIGNEVWAGKDCHRKIAAVDGIRAPQDDKNAEYD